MNDPLREAILAHTASHPGVGGVHRTAVPGLALIRGDRETKLQCVFYDPALIIVVQGSKELLLGDVRFTYRTGEYLVLTVGLPVLASITDATADRPYLAVGLTIDLRLIADLMDPFAAPVPAPPELGLFVGALDSRQTDAVTRLAALLAMPDALRALYPSIARELFYWMLAGPAGDQIRRLATPDSHTRRIAEAINVLRSDFATSVSIEALAEIAHMSPSSFHHHFKVVTSMSPLQYRKQLRLLEARRLMLAGGADATRAAYAVGYESTSQFSREYARMFGAPPRRDVAGFRAAAS